MRWEGSEDWGRELYEVKKSALSPLGLRLQLQFCADENMKIWEKQEKR